MLKVTFCIPRMSVVVTCPNWHPSTLLDLIKVLRCLRLILVLDFRRLFSSKYMFTHRTWQSMFTSLMTCYFISRYGYINHVNIVSIVSGVGIFCFGFGLTFYNGLYGLITPQIIDPADLMGVSIIRAQFNPCQSWKQCTAWSDGF